LSRGVAAKWDDTSELFAEVRFDDRALLGLVVFLLIVTVDPVVTLFAPVVLLVVVVVRLRAIHLLRLVFVVSVVYVADGLVFDRVFYRDRDSSLFRLFCLFHLFWFDLTLRARFISTLFVHFFLQYLR